MEPKKSVCFASTTLDSWSDGPLDLDHVLANEEEKEELVVAALGASLGTTRLLRSFSTSQRAAGCRIPSLPFPHRCQLPFAGTRRNSRNVAEVQWTVLHW